MSSEKRLLSTAEAASYVGYAVGTLRNQICRGTLPFRYIKNGKKVLFDRAELDRWVDRLPRFGDTQVALKQASNQTRAAKRRGGQ